jgi:putative aldouronate transport system permease protein
MLVQKSKLWTRASGYGPIYALLAPVLLYLLVYRYFPILTQFLLAFKKYTVTGGIWGSPWAGLDNFQTLFASREFVRIVTNTLRVSVLQIVSGFFPPLLLAILLFDLFSARMSRVCQSILYIPHFFSWVVIFNIVQVFFANTGYLNHLLAFFGVAPRDFLMEKSSFLPMLIGSALWKELGWGTIIYLAALTAIDTELFDVAKIDGAGPLQRVWHITLPGIQSVAVFVLTMSLGGIFSAANTEQILLFYGPQNYAVSDVIGTWIYRQALGKLQYSLGAAVSMFQSAIGLALVLLCNHIAGRTAGRGIW